jgi:hypothetical protein
MTATALAADTCMPYHHSRRRRDETDVQALDANTGLSICPKVYSVISEMVIWTREYSLLLGNTPRRTSRRSSDHRDRDGKVMRGGRGRNEAGLHLPLC